MRPNAVRAGTTGERGNPVRSVGQMTSDAQAVVLLEGVQWTCALHTYVH